MYIYLLAHNYVTVLRHATVNQPPIETGVRALKSAIELVPTEGALGVYFSPEQILASLMELTRQAEG
jgi:hypothetical protein